MGPFRPLPSITLLAVAALLPRLAHAAEEDDLAGCSGENCTQDSGAFEDVGLLQHRTRSDATVSAHSGAGVLILEAEQPFKEPPEVRSPVTLQLTTAKLCRPHQNKQHNVECWYTRAYGTDKLPASIPGPTIRVKPGETLKVIVKNLLRNPSPVCSVMSMGFCDPNSTNLHTHGLHVSAKDTQDSVFKHIYPRKTLKYAFKVLKYHMAGTHWYHPHHHHAAAIQAGGGAHGALVVDDVPGSLPAEVLAMEEKLMVLSLVDTAWTPHTNSVYGQSRLESMAFGKLWKSQKNHQYVDYENTAILVNGQFKPRLSIVAGKWYRFRMVYAAVELVLGVFPYFGQHVSCDFELLAKDGIYLHEMPRTVERIYFASGNRVDVAIRCRCTDSAKGCSTHLVSASTPPSMKIAKTSKQTQAKLQAQALHDFAEQSEKHGGLQEEHEGPLKGVDEKVVEQDLLHLDISGSADEPDLRSFKINRPCYLVDLRGVKVSKKNQGRIELMNPVDFRIGYANQLTGGMAKGKGMHTMEEKPHAELQVGQVYEWNVRGPPGNYNNKAGLSIHPFHMHVNPFQIVSLESNNQFYKAGDWHDTLLHGSGNALIKAQTNEFTGDMIFHCHLLDHEDMGMMGYFKIKGWEGTYWKGAQKVDKTCYRSLKGVGFTYLSKKSGLLEVQSRWVRSGPGENCHIACGDLGGCMGGSRPSTREQLEVVLRQTGIACSNITASAARHAPHVALDGGCSFFAAGQEKAADEEWHCDADPPADASRLCQCNGM